jgi:hypothetical protein
MNYKRLKIGSSLLSVLTLTACAPNQPAKSQIDPAQAKQDLYMSVYQTPACPNPQSLRGVAVAQDPDEALNKAKVQVAGKIQSELSSVQSQEITELSGDASNSWNSSYVENTVNKVQTKHASLFKSIALKANKGWYAQVVCASKAEISAAMRVEFDIKAKSLISLASAAKGESHPLQYKEKAVVIKSKWAQLPASWIAISTLAGSSANAQGTLFAQAKTKYLKFKNNENERKKNWRFYWKASSTGSKSYSLENATKRVLSVADLPLGSGGCQQGVSLSLDNGMANCGAGPLGPQCKVAPQLVLSSCSGEEYLRLGLDKSLVAISPAGEAKSFSKLEKQFEKKASEKWMSSLNEWQP